MNAGGWLKVADVADDLGVSARTVLRWVERGDLAACRLPGGQLRVRMSDFAAFTGERMTCAAAPARSVALPESEEV